MRSGSRQPLLLPSRAPAGPRKGRTRDGCRGSPDEQFVSGELAQPTGARRALDLLASMGSIVFVFALAIRTAEFVFYHLRAAARPLSGSAALAAAFPRSFMPTAPNCRPPPRIRRAAARALPSKLDEVAADGRQDVLRTARSSRTSGFSRVQGTKVELVRRSGSWSTGSVVTSLSRSLFEPRIAARPHVAFERLRTSIVHAGARHLMDDVFDRMGDPDGNFVDDFQGLGFHSRLFELACFAYLEESGWTIERRQRSPDFLVTKGTGKLAIEAVTSNSPLGRDEDIAAFRMPDPRDQDIVTKCNDEFPIRMGSALFSKLQHRYWEQPHCRGLPFVLIIGPFHEPGSTTYVDESLAQCLFGIERYGDWVARDGLLVREGPVTSHSFDGKTIPSNFFASDGAANVSAVLVVQPVHSPQVLPDRRRVARTSREPRFRRGPRHALRFRWLLGRGI